MEHYRRRGWGYPRVTTTVAGMSRPRTSYDEIDSPGAMRDDCAEVGRVLRLDRIARAAAAGPPSLEYDDYPREVGKREIEVSEAAARLAGALHLHLD
jgi:hypothetical protein